MPKTPPTIHHTIKSLRLDLDSAFEGKTWLLLPDGFRDRDSGQTYPLPSRRLDLQKVSSIYIPHHRDKKDSGCAYIRRCIIKWKSQQKMVGSAMLDVAKRHSQIQKAHQNYTENMKTVRADARAALESVREEAAQAIASLKDLFALGRQGLDAQMRAHLNNVKWQGETINARAFRECFRMVTAAVKGLGLPSDQKKEATEAILDQVAAALKSTQEIVALAPALESETDETIN